MLSNPRTLSCSQPMLRANADASRAVSRTGPGLVSASEDIVDDEMHCCRSEVLGALQGVLEALQQLRAGEWVLH